MLPQQERSDTGDVNATWARPFNTGMKYLAAAFALACAGAAVAAAPAPAPQPQPPDLRRLLRQYDPASTKAPPRQLSPRERAELRRQLGDSALRRR